MRNRGNGHLRARSSGFSPAQISFTSGLWLDPSDISTGFQDSAGTTPQTASGQPTGLRLDKRLGLAVGPELAIPTTTTVGWATTAASIAVVGSELEITASGGTFPIASQSFSTVIGKTYRASVNARLGTNTQTSLQVGTTQGSGNIKSVTTTGSTSTITFYFVATATTTWLDVFGAATSTAGMKNYFSSLTCKLLDGNHVSQSGAAARPEYDLISGIASDFFDGSDDQLATATFVAGTLVNGMDCFVALRRNAASAFITCFQDSVSGRVFAAGSSGGAGAALSLVGASATLAVNGTPLAGGNAVVEGTVFTACPLNTWVVLEARDLDLSAWLQFRFGFYTGAYPGNVDIGGVILCPTQSATNRSSIRRWLGTKVGLSL